MGRRGTWPRPSNIGVVSTSSFPDAAREKARGSSAAKNPMAPPSHTSYRHVLRLRVPLALARNRAFSLARDSTSNCQGSARPHAARRDGPPGSKRQGRLVPIEPTALDRRSTRDRPATRRWPTMSPAFAKRFSAQRAGGARPIDKSLRGSAVQAARDRRPNSSPHRSRPRAGGTHKTKVLPPPPRSIATLPHDGWRLVPWVWQDGCNLRRSSTVESRAAASPRRPHLEMPLGP